MAIDVNIKQNLVLSADCDDPEKNKIRPRQRVGTRMICQEEEKKIYLFGGLDTNNSTLNDMWMYDLEQNTWTEI